MKFSYKALVANQATKSSVFVFKAKAKEILQFAQIERVARSETGEILGFQRHQIASHIKEIRQYLSRTDAILPNSVIVAFIDGASITKSEDEVADVVIEVGDDIPGFVVDGQQRLTALSGIEKPDFEVFVSAIICKDYEELRQQFVLINNTRPLPKGLIYELLPTVDGLPERYTARKFAARVVERLNFTGGPALRGEIRQHTNPTGVISDTAIQKLVMNSASNGALRTFLPCDDREERSIELIDQYFDAIAKVFAKDWATRTPRNSRLRHGAGIVAMGFVMDLLFSDCNASKSEDFSGYLNLLDKHTAWGEGEWRMTDYVIPWSDIQNTPSDIDLLTRHLVSRMKAELKKMRKNLSIKVA